MRVFVILCISFAACSTFNGAGGVVWPCADDVDCSSVERATCSPYNSCRCPAGFVFSTNLTKCLKASLYGEECEESVQCSHMPSGARCNKNRICECDDGYTYIRGRCSILSGLEGHCKEDNDCWFGYDRESVTCEENKCTCAKGYYKRYSNICRRKSMGADSACIVDSDCGFIKKNGFKCENFKCKKPKASKDIAVQTSFDVFHLNPVLETSEENIEDEIKIELKDFSVQTGTESKFGDACTNNGKECKGLHHSICVENLCYCQLGYYNDGDKCMAELGEVAANKDYCNKTQMVFNPETRKCACPPLKYTEPSLRICRKHISSFTAPCVTQSQCSPYGLAFCNTELVTKRCMCEPYAHFDEKRELCIYNKEGLGGYCENNCTIPHSTCSKEKQCVCQKYYTERNGQCFPGIGGECTKDQDCVVERTECKPAIKDALEVKSVCKCKKGSVQYQDKCLKEATEVGEECIDTEQCKPLLGELGKCINKKCTCEEHHHLSFAKCEEKKVIGEACSKSSECFTPEEPKSIECRNSVCRCQLGYTTDVEKHICIKPNKNSSGRPSVLKIITFLLIGSAFLITSAAIKQAYY